MANSILWSMARAEDLCLQMFDVRTEIPHFCAMSPLTSTFTSWDSRWRLGIGCAKSSDALADGAGGCSFGKHKPLQGSNRMPKEIKHATPHRRVMAFLPGPTGGPERRASK
jgi:hypothetical protein